MHPIIEGIENKTIGRVVFEVMDPFNEQSSLAENDAEKVKLAIDEKLICGERELGTLCDALMANFVRHAMTQHKIQNMAENWMTLFKNLPRDYEQKIANEAAKMRKSKKKEPCLYDFIKEFKTGKREEIRNNLQNAPLKMFIYATSRKNAGYEPHFIIYRVKRMKKVVFKTARNIYNNGEELNKKKRMGLKLDYSEEKTEILRKSTVQDTFGVKIVPLDIRSASRMIEFLYKKYIVVEDEDFYRQPRKDKIDYRARHITIMSPESRNYYVEVHFVGLEDFINIECWRLSHPHKDVKDFNTMSKNPRFKKLYAKGEFLVS